MFTYPRYSIRHTAFHVYHTITYSESLHRGYSRDRGRPTLVILTVQRRPIRLRLTNHRETLREERKGKSYSGVSAGWFELFQRLKMRVVNPTGSFLFSLSPHFFNSMVPRCLIDDKIQKRTKDERKKLTFRGYFVLMKKKK